MLLILCIVLILISIPMYYVASDGFQLSSINILNYFFYHTFILSIIGSLILGSNLSNHYQFRMIENISRAEKMGLFWINFSFFLLAFLWFLYKYILKNKGIETSYKNKIKQKYIYLTAKEDRKFMKVFLLFFILSAISIFYVFITIGIENIPILRLVKGESMQSLAILRQQVGRNFPGNVYIKNIFGIALMPLLSYISFVSMKKTDNRNWLHIFTISFILTFLILTYDLQKAPFLRYMFGYVIIVPYTNKIGNSKAKFILGLVMITTLVFFILLTPVNLDTFFSFRYGPFNRIFKSQAYSVFAHFDVFPNRANFLYGQSFPNIISKTFLGKEQLRSARIVMEVINPSGITAGTSGVMNGFFIAEAYANYSYPGIIFSIFIVSIILYFVHILFINSYKNPVTIGLYAYLSNILINITQGGFVDFIYNPQLVIVLIISLILLYNYGSRKEFLK